MIKPWRLTLQAEASLEDIARWTVETFGPRQADVYQDEIIETCEAIASGQAISRDCSVLLEETANSGLRYTRCGGHYILFVEQQAGFVIVDILHSRSDLPRHIERLKKR